MGGQGIEMGGGVGSGGGGGGEDVLVPLLVSVYLILTNILLVNLLIAMFRLAGVGVGGCW